MKKVRREDLVDYQTWTDDVRPQQEERIYGIKRDRRIHVGDALTFLFENADTVRWQVQEMMRVEHIVKDKDILHELQTYNELIGGDGELGAVLLIEIEEPEERDAKLRAWRDMPGHWYVRTARGKVHSRVDERQMDDTRLSSVQYLIFDTQGEVPLAVGCDHAAYTVETVLTTVQRDALAADLAT